VKEEKAVHMAKPGEAQQEWRRSLVVELRKKAKEHCSKRVLEEALLLELRWCMKKVIVIYIQCKRYGEKKCYVKENKRQGVIKDRQK